jgi:hypothetical protein
MEEFKGIETDTLKQMLRDLSGNLPYMIKETIRKPRDRSGYRRVAQKAQLINRLIDELESRYDEYIID